MKSEQRHTRTNAVMNKADLVSGCPADDRFPDTVFRVEIFPVRAVLRRNFKHQQTRLAYRANKRVDPAI